MFAALGYSEAQIATLAVLSFLANWNDFLWPIYVLLSPENQTLQPGLAVLQGAYSTHYAIVMAGAVIASVPVLILFTLAQRQIVESVAASPRGDRLAIEVDAGDHSEARILDARTLKVIAKVSAPLGGIWFTRFSDDGLKIPATITSADAPTDKLGTRFGRDGYPVATPTGERIGEITSGGPSPFLKKAIAIAFVPVDYSALDTELAVEIRNQPVSAKVVPLPFYKRPKKTTFA